MPKKCWNGWSWTFSLSQVPWLPTLPTLGFQAVKASTTRFLDFGSGFKESELHSGRKGFEIPIEILLKTQKSEFRGKRPPGPLHCQAGKTLMTFWERLGTWECGWPKSDQKRQQESKKEKPIASSVPRRSPIQHTSSLPMNEVKQC